MSSLKRTDVLVEHVKGSGPGGQNRNKRMSGIRLVHVPTGITVWTTERRSQSQNLSLAWVRLEEKVRKFFAKPNPRLATSIPRKERSARRQQKTVRSAVKRQRKVSRQDFE